jgi:hypothetical protein
MVKARFSGRSSLICRSPHFVIIGAMKAGTTTLYRDLLKNPSIYMPIDKEPEYLVGSWGLDELRLAYSRLFQRADANQFLGEASTAYSKRPTFSGAADRARALVGPHLKIIYLVRDPIERIQSQYLHEYAAGSVVVDINRAVRDYPRYTNYSMYSMQLLPWLRAFGRSNVFVLKFEDYIVDRAAKVAEVSRFLGVDPYTDTLEVGKRYYATSHARKYSPVWRHIQASEGYRRFLRPLLTAEMRLRLQKTLLPAASMPTVDLEDETRAWLWDELRPSLEEIRTLTACSRFDWDL